MKSYITTFVIFLASCCAFAQMPMPGAGGGAHKVKAQPKFEIIVSNQTSSDSVFKLNQMVDLKQKQNKAPTAGTTKAFLDDVVAATSQTAVGQVVTVSTSLLGLGVNAISKAIKGDSREEWYKAAQDQCRFTRILKTDSKIDDFYYIPSVKGAMDPENLKFEGFGCRSYIEEIDRPGNGVECFYVFCKLRKDSVGIGHIVNHSKFMVEIDTLRFVPKYCHVPNDSTGRMETTFDYAKRNDLTLNITVNIYSSWINQAIMVTQDQLLGTFTIQAKIDPELIGEDGVFVYDKNNPQYEVSVTGDSFIVPRSFTGTTDALTYTPAWGTGQYRVEMIVSESCTINDSYYQASASEPGQQPKWDKEKWQAEWKTMKNASKQPSMWQSALATITSGYTNNGWVAIIAEPITTTIIASETTALNGLLNLGDSSEMGNGPSEGNADMPTGGMPPH